MHTTVQNKQGLIRLLQENSQKIKNYGVAKLSLFGSFSTGNFRPDSDVDLLIEFEAGKKTYDNFMELSFFLEELFGRRVELVTPQSLNRYIGPHILNQAEHVTI
ncbi:nucleotidyltransferase family protein [Mucilaginibacter paludis]|uniref:DNA polymerase beta domain protein region n=1 Tax=Mucilaginibacter paludis DSM 18603 TaxID=714943 RepID=H1Y802_9SPHI|nr:nucleotidyltransferase family protein [Mucilaginibacter paludis]EHQ30488.1 DNA polymerase beta domain protein region [Mucilaginibacter paludis DSM 18603]